MAIQNNYLPHIPQFSEAELQEVRAGASYRDIRALQPWEFSLTDRDNEKMYELSVPHPESAHNQLFIVFLGGLYSVSQRSCTQNPSEMLADFSDIVSVKTTGNFWQTKKQVSVNNNVVAKLLCFLMIESEIEPEIVASNIKSSPTTIIASLLLQMNDYRASMVLDRLSKEIPETKWLEIITFLVEHDLTKAAIYSNFIFSSQEKSLNLFLKLDNQPFEKLIPLLSSDSLTALVLNEYESVSEPEWKKVISLFELLVSHRVGRFNEGGTENRENLSKLICLENFDEEVMAEEKKLSKGSLVKLQLMKSGSQTLKNHVAQSLTKQEQRAHLASISSKSLYDDSESYNFDCLVTWSVLVQRIIEGEKIEFIFQNAHQNLKDFILTNYLDLYKQVTLEKQLEFLISCSSYLLEKFSDSTDKLEKSKLIEILLGVKSNAPHSSRDINAEAEVLCALMGSLNGRSKFSFIKKVDDLFGENVSSKLLLSLVREKPEYFADMAEDSPIFCKKLCMKLDSKEKLLMEDVLQAELIKLPGDEKLIFAICLLNILSMFNDASSTVELVTAELGKELSPEVVKYIWSRYQALFFILYESSSDSRKTKLFNLLELKERGEFLSDVGRYIASDSCEAIGKHSARLIFLLGTTPNSALLATEAINDHEFAELLIQMEPLTRESLLVLLPKRRISIIQNEKEILASLANKEVLKVAKAARIASTKGTKN